MSYNNLLDADAATFSLRALMDGQPDNLQGCVVIKHGTPCGAAISTDYSAVQDAISGDPTSAFGGIIALSSEVQAAHADILSSLFLEVVIAQKFSNDARKIFSRKKNLRLLEIPELMSAPLSKFSMRSISGGDVLLQQADMPFTKIREAQIVTKRSPTDAEYKALDIAFRMCVPTKSNAITLANSSKLLGSGSGQTSRVDSVEIAFKKAKTHGHTVNGASLGSDAFFPFTDGIEKAAQAGVKAIAQPGGSIRDKEVIACADEHGLAMLFTGERHFRH